MEYGLSFSDLILFVFKQKTAYGRRISDWSSDVCSSDLPANAPAPRWGGANPPPPPLKLLGRAEKPPPAAGPAREKDRKSVVSGKSVAVRVEVAGRRIIKKEKRQTS